MRSCLILILIFLNFSSIRSECPLESLLEPCACVLAIPSHTYLIANDYSPETIIEQQRSIVCENIDDDSFDLESIFIRLSSISDENQTAFDSFLLSNTSVEQIAKNVFHNITFTCLMFQDNRRLTTIDRDAFTSINKYVEIFETLNTNLSNSDEIFSILRPFENLRRLSMHNDRWTRIPPYAFNQTKLSQIWFGLENQRSSQSIESIGAYAFYHLTSLRVLRIFSPSLTTIDRYAFAQRSRSTNNQTLTILLGGSNINSTSFPVTSLTRFRNRRVDLRFYFTTLTFFDEDVFQPFLEANPQSSIELHRTNLFFRCDCRSAWIQLDYQGENRVIGYPCWSNDFSHCSPK